MVPEANVVALPRHPGDDVADAAPGVEAAVQQLQLGRARLEGEEAEGGAERGAAVGRLHCERLPWRRDRRGSPVALVGGTRRTGLSAVGSFAPRVAACFHAGLVVGPLVHTQEASSVALQLVLGELLKARVLPHHRRQREDMPVRGAQACRVSITSASAAVFFTAATVSINSRAGPLALYRPTAYSALLASGGAQCAVARSCLSASPFSSPQAPAFADRAQDLAAQASRSAAVDMPVRADFRGDFATKSCPLSEKAAHQLRRVRDDYRGRQDSAQTDD